MSSPNDMMENAMPNRVPITLISPVRRTNIVGWRAKNVPVKKPYTTATTKTPATFLTPINPKLVTARMAVVTMIMFIGPMISAR